MGLAFVILSIVCIVTGATHTFHRNGKAMRRMGKKSVSREVEVITVMVIRIGPAAHLKIMMITLGGLFMLFGLICLSVSGN